MNIGAPGPSSRKDVNQSVLINILFHYFNCSARSRLVKEMSCVFLIDFTRAAHTCATGRKYALALNEQWLAIPRVHCLLNPLLSPLCFVRNVGKAAETSVNGDVSYQSGHYAASVVAAKNSILVDNKQDVKLYSVAT